MARPLVLHEDRLFPSEPSQRGIARALFQADLYFDQI
ncbi:MAG: hypothetical protein JWM77_3808, partial [Rhodospirillales bacterium]|nr:hypothetical protein [Rhodospirillales bacterium]